MALYDANPLTFRVDAGVITGSVFKFHDTLTSRAEIGDLAAVFKSEVIALHGDRAPSEGRGAQRQVIRP